MSTNQGSSDGSKASAKLIVYVHKSLLGTDDDGKNKINNLTFSRVVNGVANTVYSSIYSSDIDEDNLLDWSNDWAIAATKTPAASGDPIREPPSKKDIKIGQSCNWTDEFGQPLRSVPDPKDDADFKGVFGAKNQATEWHNTIWVRNSDNKRHAIYQDHREHTRLAERKYRVDNSYQLSWESVNYIEGTYVAEWSQPHLLFFDEQQGPYYVSWGPSGGDTGKPEWFHYGTKDPKGHDPKKAIIDSSSVAFRAPELAAVSDYQIGVDLSWTDADGPQEPAKNNLLIQEFLALNKTYSPLSFADVLSSWDYKSLTFSATINEKSRTKDVLAGVTNKEKIIHYLRGLLAILPVEYSPNRVEFVTLAHTNEDDVPAQNGAEAQNGA